MLDGLDDIEWAALAHNYGSAESIPGLLKAAARGEPARSANDSLDNQLYHQGGWVCSAATAALPFLLDLLESPEAAERDELALLVARLAQEANGAGGEHVHDGWHTAWAAAFPRVAALLGDPDQEVRDCLAWAVGESTRQRDEAVAALKARFEVEGAAQVRTTILEAIRDLGGEGATAWLEKVAGRRADTSAAAILAVHELAGTTVDAAGLAAVVDALTDTGSDSWETLPSVLSGDTPALTPDQRATVAEALIGHPEDVRRVMAIRLANRLLAEHRELDGRLTGLLAAHLGDPGTRFRVLEVLAAGAAPFPDVYAHHLDDTTPSGRRAPETVADAALWALVRLGDVRCAVPLREQIATGERHTRAHDSGVHIWALPSLGEMLEQVPDAFVPRLLPALRRALAEGGNTARLDYLNTLAAWGPKGAAARPEVEALLGSEAGRMAEQALDAMAASAPEPPDPGDLTATDPWTRTRAAHRLWRATGERAEAARVLIAVVEQVLDGPQALPVGRTAITHLAEMGATEAVPVARRILAEERRLHYFGGWRVFTEDESWRRAARALLEA